VGVLFRLMPLAWNRIRHAERSIPIISIVTRDALRRRDAGVARLPGVIAALRRSHPRSRLTCARWDPARRRAPHRRAGPGPCTGRRGRAFRDIECTRWHVSRWCSSCPEHPAPAAPPTGRSCPEDYFLHEQAVVQRRFIEQLLAAARAPRPDQPASAVEAQGCVTRARLSLLAAPLTDASRGPPDHMSGPQFPTSRPTGPPRRAGSPRGSALTTELPHHSTLIAAAPRRVAPAPRLRPVTRVQPLITSALLV